MKKMIGYMLLSSPFLVILVIAVLNNVLSVAFLAFGVTAVIVFVVSVGVFLING